LFGGTFNPVHWGHLRSAEEIREQFGLSRVIFIPVHVPPHKKAAVISSEHRFNMVRKAISGNRFFRVSDLELQRPGKSYSIDTIRHFHGLSRGQEEIYFILGTDAFREITAWKDYPAFFSACNFIVMTRPGANDVRAAELLPRDIQAQTMCGPLSCCHGTYKKNLPVSRTRAALCTHQGTAFIPPR